MSRKNAGSFGYVPVGAPVDDVAEWLRSPQGRAWSQSEFTGPTGGWNIWSPAGDRFGLFSVKGTSCPGKYCALCHPEPGSEDYTPNYAWRWRGTKPHPGGAHP